MTDVTPQLNQLDQLMVALFWDAEFIARDGDSQTYAVFPREPQDSAMAARIGATIADHLTAPALVWVNTIEET